MLNWSLATVGLQNLLPINPKRITQENQNINLILIKMELKFIVKIADQYIILSALEYEKYLIYGFIK